MGLFSMIFTACLLGFGPVHAANDTVIIKFKNVGLSVNSSVDSHTVLPPTPPGVQLVANLEFLGYQIYRLEDPHESPASYCAELEQYDNTVDFCEPDSEVSLIGEQSVTPNDPLYSQQPNLQTINVPALWKKSIFGANNVSVCFPDTGSSPDHPDLSSSLKKGTSFVGGSQSDSFIDGNGHGQSRWPTCLLLGAIMQAMLLIVVVMQERL